MPLLVLVPMLTFVLVVSGVRSRRATSNVTALGLLVTLAAVALVGWARYRVAAPYVVTYQWINIPTSFAGAPQFQGFGIDISFRVDHAALAAAAGVLLSALGIVGWHRSAGRAEAGPARFHAELALGVAAAIGVLVSGDLAALAAWWGLGGVATYLLLAHRWGTEAAGRASRLGLWLPFLGDVMLWCAVAVVYSRFGQLDIDKLAAPGVLHGTYQAGLRSLSLAAILFGLAALVRGGVFPFTGWQTALEAPPAAAAWTQSVWPVLAVVMVLRVVPIFDAAGPEPYRVFVILCAIGVAGGALASLAVNDLRRSAAWAGSAVAALALLGPGLPGSPATSLLAVLTLALARPVVAVSAWAIAAAMRSGDLADMGATWRRMRRTSVAYLVAAIVLALAAAPKGAALAGGGWRGAWAMAVALLVVGVALLRPYGAVAHGELRRRRAFEPTRVREVAAAATTSALLLAVAGAVPVLVGFVPAWAGWLGGRGHPAQPLPVLLWVAIGLAGAAIGFAAGGWRRDLVVGWSARSQAVIAGYAGLGALAGDRLLARPALAVIDAVERQGVERGAGALGGSLASGGGWIRGRLFDLGGGALGFAVLAIAVGAVLFALLAGTGR